MSNAVSQLDVAAERLSRTTVAVSDPNQNGDAVQLSDEMVALMSAKTQFQANVQAAKVVDDVQKSTLSLLG